MRRAESKETSLADSSAPYLVAGCGDTVRIFDLTAKTGVSCVQSYVPTRGSQVNCVKWNHTNHVVASCGDDKKISLWRRNGKSLGTLQLSRIDGGELADETVTAINFCNKGSRYLCSGGTGHVVRIWDLQKKLCIKKLSGHTDTITGVMYNCKDEHLASISLNGNLILHNLASGSQAASLKDPQGQALRVLDCSRYSRQNLVTAGDDGSVHLWDTTGKTPKMSWWKQHSAPTTGACILPSGDKVIASAGLDKKLYIFDSASKRPTFFVSYEAPFSSLVFRDDGYVLAAGTSTGRVVFYDVRGKPQSLTVLIANSNNVAISGLCWQRSKQELIDENMTDEVALLGNTIEDSVLMPDPLPSMSTLNFSSSNLAVSRNSLTGTSNITTSKYSSAMEEITWKGNPTGSLTRLHAPRSSHNLKDDMDVFSPLVDVQPITPSLSSLWDDKDDDAFRGGLQLEKKPSLGPSIRKFAYPEMSTDNQTTRDWRSSSTTFQPLESWSSNMISDKLASLHEEARSLSRISQPESTSSVSKFAGLQDVPDSLSHALKNSLSSSSSSLMNVQSKLAFTRDSPTLFPEALATTQESLPRGQATGVANLDASFSSSVPRRFSTYAERLSAATSIGDGTSSAVVSPKAKKVGTEMRADPTGLFSKQDPLGYMGNTSLPGTSICEPQLDGRQSADQHQGFSSFSLQLIQRTLEETLGSVQKSIHEDVRNLHIELIRQFHMHEIEMSNLLNSVLEKQDELLKEVQTLRKENQQLRQLL